MHAWAIHGVSALPRRLRLPQERISVMTSPNPSEMSAANAGSANSPVHLHSILVPTDFSEDSFRAVQYARSLGQVFRSQVTLLHVLVPVAAPAGNTLFPISICSGTHAILARKAR